MLLHPCTGSGTWRLGRRGPSAASSSARCKLLDGSNQELQAQPSHLELLRLLLHRLLLRRLGRLLLGRLLLAGGRFLLRSLALLACAARE
jgi:hypothetical protein